MADRKLARLLLLRWPAIPIYFDKHVVVRLAVFFLVDNCTCVLLVGSQYECALHRYFSVSCRRRRNPQLTPQLSAVHVHTFVSSPSLAMEQLLSVTALPHVQVLKRTKSDVDPAVSQTAASFNLRIQHRQSIRVRQHPDCGRSI